MFYIVCVWDLSMLSVDEIFFMVIVCVCFLNRFLVSCKGEEIVRRIVSGSKKLMM